MNNKIYLAGPFFNPEQISVQERLEQLCVRKGIPMFSPRLECLCPPDASSEQRASTFAMNVDHIVKAKFVFARIDDFDPGTMWELGYAFAFGIPSFAYTTVPGRGLNLMLAESGLRLVCDWPDIEKFLVEGDLTVAKSWKGEIE